MPDFKSCLFIMADGARPDVLSELLRKGELPNISTYLVEKGECREAVTVFPSTTGPAYTPYVYGKFPGRCNFPGIRWFDRCEYPNLFSTKRFRSYISPETYFMNSDVACETESLFEIFPRSVNILNELSRGVSFRNDRTRFSKLYYKVKGHFTDRSDEVDIVAERILLKSLKEFPDFVFTVFLGIDTYSHINHPFHKKVLDSYRRLDRTVGLVCEYLKEEGRLDETLLVIASDHGLTQTHSHFDTLGFMRARRYKTFHYPSILRHLTGADASVMVSGNAMANIYVKSPRGWESRSRFEELGELAESLCERPEVDIVAGLDSAGRTRIKSERGEAVAWIEGETLKYEKLKEDPFGYNGMPSSMSMSEALSETWDTDYPDGPLQVVQLLEARRAGDIVISACKGYDLRAGHENPEHRSSHGALFRDHMIIPVLSNARLGREFLRTVDIYTSILNLMGVDPPSGLDGVGAG